MAVLAESGSNPDVDLLYDINGLAKDAPHWFDRGVEFMGEYGLLIVMVLLVVWCWWSLRRRGGAGGGDDAASSMAALVWAPLAAGVAVLVNVPIRGFVERPRPFVDHRGIDVLVSGKTDFSFVSDHATITMALGVGLFVAHRRFGLAGIGLALLEGFCRVYMGVHYPTDVVGGFALGTAVVLLLSPLAVALLTPVMKAMEGARGVGRLIRSRPVADGQDEALVPGARTPAVSEERDLAA
ncbi:phosphatase PAP2 family protein [Streptomyces brasiliensis]|uniref:Phosphatase PAP2 family protein n=1 Tax=Streptomyces brasiliensis TaxID=1954 RepID=A0A917L4U4_9ACTN|nr:phosphatase PAP2 family protein [Streptomyces brasiliensis]GGJ44632.1 phosphatase PAP2 family protein [Streptomyces brasiliensis]